MNGLPIRSWADVSALGALLVMALAGLAWGLKLDNRATENERHTQAIDQHLSANDSRLDAGMLPATAARFTEVVRQIDALQTEVRDLHARDRELTDRISIAEHQSANRR